MKLKKLKSILACVLVLCMLFGVQSNLAFAQENDDTIAQENVADSTTDDTTGATTDDTKNTDTTGEDDVNTKTESGSEIMNRSIAETEPEAEITPQSNDTIRGNCGPYSINGYTNTVTWRLDSSTSSENMYTLIISGSGPMGDAYTGYPNNINSGAPEWDAYSNQIEKVVIESGVTSVGAKSFKNCKNLKLVSLPSSLLRIGKDSFYGSAIASINLPENLETIEEQAFYNSSLSGSLSVPSRVTSIPTYAFGKTNIEEVVFKGAITEIGTSAFQECKSLKEIQLPNTITTIGAQAFMNCSDLTKIALPDNSNFIKINKDTFKNCSKLSSLFIPDSVIQIENSAFEGCSSLEKVILPNQLTTFGSKAFYGASSLVAAYIPSSVKNIPQGINANNQIFKGMSSNSVIYLGNKSLIALMLQKSSNLDSTSNGFDTTKTALAVTNGGTFADDTVFEQGKLAVPSKSGSIFKGWYTKDGTNNDWGDKVTMPTTGETYYAKWIELKTDDVSMEYGSTKALPTIADVTLSNWESGDRTIVSIEGKKLKANKVGKTTITATATDDHGSTGTLTVNIEVTPMRIIYGSPDETEDGRPYIVYSLNEDGTAPKISDILGFYPVKEKHGESGTYEADTSKSKITLKPGMGADGDVEYTYVNDVSDNQITTDTLPTHPTVDEKGNPHSIRVKMKLKNPNYRFTTVGTDWKPEDTIILYVTCYEKGMVEVDMYLEGDENPLDTFDERQEYEYTGEGIVPTTRDLTTLYTKGETTTNTITQFTAHFHAVEEGTAFSGTHLTKVKNTELTTDALKAIAPKELGVYSFVVNGYNNYTKTYCYVSRRYRIIKGSPKGCPTFNFIESGKTLSDVQLSGTMKNKIGKTVTGTFTWENGTQTVQAGTAYKWTFTPDDNDHYEVVNGESIVCPIHQVIFDTNGGSKVNETNAEYNKEISEPETTREGYRFVGWYTNKECTKVFDFKTPITQDITLYAKWNGIPTIKANDVVLTIGDKFDAKANVTATDKEDGDITKSIEVISNNVDTSKAGTYKVIYKATDSQGASVTKAITVTIKEKETQKPATDTDKKPTGTDTDKKPANTDKLTASDNPETGDTANITAWLALMIVSLGLLAGSFAVRKSRKS